MGVTKTVCSTDPAIDYEKSNLHKFVATREWKHLVFVNGALPVIYHLRDIPRRVVVTWIESGADQHTKHLRAFMSSVVAWENRYVGEGPITRQSQKTEVPKWQENAADDGTLTMDELELFHPEDVLEIGAYAYERSFLRPGKAHLFVPPRSFQNALERVLCRHAGEKVQKALLNSEEPKERQDTPREEHGEPTTDANATESRSIRNELHDHVSF